MKTLKTILLGCCILISFQLIAQPDEYNELIIPKHGQKASLWCWSASKEIIVDSWNVIGNISQCAIADTYLSSSYAPNPGHNYNVPTDLGCDTICPSGWLIGAGDFNVYMPFNLGGSGPSNIDLVFSDLGFYSMEESTNLLTWTNYIKEIDQCRPVILIYGIQEILNGNIDYYNHAVVAKGYYTFYDNTLERNFFLVNDPLQICTGREYLISRAALDRVVGVTTVEGKLVYDIIPETINIAPISALTHHIYPKNYPIDTCVIDSYSLHNSIIKQMPDNLLISILIENKDKFIGTANNGVFSEGYIKELSGGNHYTTTVEYLSYDKISTNPSKNEISTKRGVTNKKEKNVTYIRSKIPLTATIGCDETGENCIVERIFLEENTARTVVIENEIFELNNNPNTEINGKQIKYGIVKYLPYPLEFYKVTYENNLYLIPKDILAKSIYKTDKVKRGLLVAIPEKEIIRGLEAYTLENPLFRSEERVKVNKVKRLYKKLAKKLNKYYKPFKK